VTEHVGKYDRPQFSAFGVVAVMKNGDGPTVLVRADIDALPVEEKNNVPYASKVKTKNEVGQGSQRHARVRSRRAHHEPDRSGEDLAALKDQWHGTLILIGQPAEETVDGAKAMLADGLYTRFPQARFYDWITRQRRRRGRQGLICSRVRDGELNLSRFDHSRTWRPWLET